MKVPEYCFLQSSFYFDILGQARATQTAYSGSCHIQNGTECPPPPCFQIPTPEATTSGYVCMWSLGPLGNRNTHIPTSQHSLVPPLQTCPTQGLRNRPKRSIQSPAPSAYPSLQSHGMTYGSQSARGNYITPNTGGGVRGGMEGKNFDQVEWSLTHSRSTNSGLNLKHCPAARGR